jgi:hypothetical protein
MATRNRQSTRPQSQFEQGWEHSQHTPDTLPATATKLTDLFRRLLNRVGLPDLALDDLRRLLTSEENAVPTFALRNVGPKKRPDWQYRKLDIQFWREYPFLLDVRTNKEGGFSLVYLTKGLDELDAKSLIKARWFFYADREKAEAASAPIAAATTAERPERSRRGPTVMFDWAAIQIQFFWFLFDEDVSANGQINADAWAGRLKEWCDASFGEGASPQQSTIRAKVSEWTPIWQRWKSALEAVPRETRGDWKRQPISRGFGISRN